jgi:hypothetical protein
MSFDAALKRVFDSALQELTVLATEERNRAREEGATEARAQGLTDGREQGRAEGLKEGLEQGRTEGIKEGREQGKVEGREEAAKESQVALSAAVAAAKAESVSSFAANGRLLDAIRAIDEAGTLSDVLETLAARAATEAGRAAVLLVRGRRLAAWKLLGFGFASPPSSIDVALEEAGALGAAVEAGTFTTVGPGGRPVPPVFAELLGERDTVAAPLTLFGETVAVLLADEGDGGGKTSSSGVIEILARHASRALEALTAIKAARSLAGVSTASPADDPHEEADDEDSSARRYARLLVSEIKLYHEAAVVAGRRERDLASRLGGEISRARVLYEQRVPAAVRERRDYFRDELVRTLANGDATLLRLS